MELKPFGYAVPVPTQARPHALTVERQEKVGVDKLTLVKLGAAFKLPGKELYLITAVEALAVSALNKYEAPDNAAEFVDA
jgi:hypothetical protein